MNKREEFDKALGEYAAKCFEGGRATEHNEEPDSAVAEYREVLRLFDAAQPSQDGLPALPEPVYKRRTQICCGNYVVGGDYMGLQEMTCCGQPNEDEEPVFSEAQMLAYGAQCRASGQWIACSERLPENGVLVLYFYHGEIEIAEWRQTERGQVWYEANTGERLAAPTHWMPFPPCLSQPRRKTGNA